MTALYLRPDGDVALDGWTDHADGTSNIAQTLDETSAGDSDFVQSPAAAGSDDLKVRLFDGSTQIVEWTHTDVAETFADAEQTLTAPQVAAITDFSNLFAEFDDNQGNVYRFALGNPATGVDPPIKVRYRYKKLITGGGTTTTTWNPSDNFGMTLSGGNLTASAVGTGGAVVRAIASASSGKYYWEVTVTPSVVECAHGIISTSVSLSSGYVIGFINDTAGPYYNGQLRVEGSHVLTGEGFGLGAVAYVLCFAVDLDNGKMWYRAVGSGNTGDWNGDVIGNQNPATNTGGANISGVALPVHAAINLAGAESWTANFGGSAYAHTPPAGFGNW